MPPAITPNIAVRADDPAMLEAALHLAGQLALPCFLSTAPELKSYDYFLEVTLTEQPPGMQLGLSQNQQQQKPLVIDFTVGKTAYRREHGGGRQQSIARAVGIKPNSNLDIVDVTAGLGQDAFVLASLGCRVRLLERSPLIAALLDNALQRAAAHSATQSIVNHMQLLQGDAIEWMRKIDKQQAPEVIYMDPMYPHRSKSALVKKSMRMLREIVGDDPDSDKLLNAALRCAQKRVVVKRPKGAPLVDQLTPSHRIEDKTTRFDVYMIHQPNSVDQ